MDWLLTRWWVSGGASILAAIAAFSVFAPNAGWWLPFKSVTFIVMMFIAVFYACEAGHLFEAERE